MPNRRKLFTCCFLLFFPISPAFVGQQRRLRLFLQMATDSSPTMNPCKDGLVKIGDSDWFFFSLLGIKDESCSTHLPIDLTATRCQFPTGLFSVAFLMQDW